MQLFLRCSRPSIQSPQTPGPSHDLCDYPIFGPPSPPARNTTALAVDLSKTRSQSIRHVSESDLKLSSTRHDWHTDRADAEQCACPYHGLSDEPASRASWTVRGLSSVHAGARSLDLAIVISQIVITRIRIVRICLVVLASLSASFTCLKHCGINWTLYALPRARTS